MIYGETAPEDIGMPAMLPIDEHPAIGFFPEQNDVPQAMSNLPHKALRVGAIAVSARRDGTSVVVQIPKLNNQSQEHS